jgi:atlastin
MYIVSLRGGADRETTGILMWSKLYLLRNSNNKEVVVALMDTQVEQ